MNKTFFVAMALALALGACGGATPAPTGAPSAQPTKTTGAQPAPLPTPISTDSMKLTPNPSTQTSPTIARAANDFGFKMFARLTGGKTSNTFISPLSISMALAMAYNGADGKTAQDMAASMGLQGASLAEVNAAYASLAGQLQASKEITLSIANSLWARQGIPLKQDFVAQVGKAYDAKLTSLDFASPNALAQINGWVSDKTRGKIPTILESIPPDAVLYLINAVYFKGAWLAPFVAEQTKPAPFHAPMGDVTAQMMNRYDDMLYLDDPLFQAVSLPYTGSQLSMIVVLPKGSLDSFAPELTAENWQKWSRALRSRKGSLQLPRFKMEYSQTLNEALMGMGMGNAFSDQANFSKMSDVPFAISEVRHKSFVEVNEQGAEAAAVTSIGMRAMSAREAEPPFQMTVDRPFVFAIQDNRTGAVLFLGTVAKIN